MLSLFAPSEQQLTQFLKHAGTLPFSYPEVGATRGTLPNGYRIDRNRICLGHGREVFRRASEAILGWRHYPTGWLRRYPAHIPIREGQTVVVSARAFGLWATVGCKIVYVIESTRDARQFGFAYGTLAGHVEVGEERFLVSWTSDDSVWYEVLAFSRPRPLWAKLCLPAIRAVQKKFFTQSLIAMTAAVGPSD